MLIYVHSTAYSLTSTADVPEQILLKTVNQALVCKIRCGISSEGKPARKVRFILHKLVTASNATLAWAAKK